MAVLPRRSLVSAAVVFVTLAAITDSGCALPALDQFGGFLLGVGTCAAVGAAWWAFRSRKDQGKAGDGAST